MKRETLLNIIAVITWIFTIIFVFTLVTSSLFSRNFHLFLVFSFGGISTIGGLVLFAMEHQSIFKKLFDTTAAKLVAAALTYAVITISMIYTDRFIADTTGVNPSSFDNARNILVLFIAPLFWTLVFYFITIVIYIFQFFHISFSTFKNSRSQVIVRNAAAFVSLLVCSRFMRQNQLKTSLSRP